MAVTEATHSAGPHAVRVHRVRWLWTLALCLAPIVIVALTQDIGGRAYDAAVEHIQRGVAFSDVLSDGVLYPRWSQLLHWGLGSPLFTFQPPLPYHSLDLLHRLGLSHDMGWRWLMAGGYILAFCGAYLLVREISERRWAALTAAVAYTYAPYVIRNGLERGSNEAYSMFLYPLVLWSLLALARRPSVGRFLLAVALWAACIGSHVLGPLMLAPFAAVLALYLWRRQRTPAPLLALLAGGLLTAFIWAPMVPEQRWVHVERDFTQPEAIPADNPIPLADLLAPPAVYDSGFDNNKTGDRVGLLQTALLALAAAAAPFVWRGRIRPRDRSELGLALGAVALAGLFLFFLLTAASDPLWRLGGSLAAHLLYRTRLMGAQALAAAVAAGLLLASVPSRVLRVLAPLTAAVLLLVALPSLYVQYQHQYADFSQGATQQGVREMEITHGGRALTAFGEFEPKWRSAPFDEGLLAQLGRDFDADERPLANASDAIRVVSADVRNQAWDLTLLLAEPATATLHLLYYPRWQATVDGQPAAVGHQETTGYLQVPIPAGEHRLVLRYGMTGAERAGLTLSALTLLTLVGWTVWRLAARRRGRISSSGQSAAATPVPDRRFVERPAPAWVLLGLSLLLALKVGFVDPRTTLFRRASTCDVVQGNVTALGVRFGESLRLCAMSPVPAEVRPGERLSVTLYWLAEKPLARRASSFVHLLGAQFNPATNNPLWGQEDTEVPAGLPVEQWMPGKLYKDDYTFTVADGAPAGPYQLEIGWYVPDQGQRIRPVIERPSAALTVSDLDALLVSGPAIR